MTTTPEELYIQSMMELIEQYSSLADETVAQAIVLMNQLRDEIAGELINIPETDAYHIQYVINALDDDIAQYNASLTRTVQGASQAANQLGALLIVEPINYLGQEITWVSSNPLASIASEFSAELITNISQETLAKINQILRLGAMGTMTPYELMKRIDAILGLFGDKLTGIAYRSEMIIRTELGRIWNMSSYSQQLATLGQIPGMLKVWMAVGDWRTRDSHLDAHRRYTSNPIPLEQPFMVGEDLLMYPLDPNGSPEEVINCRCVSISVHPEIGYIETPLDEMIFSEMGRRGLL